MKKFLVILIVFGLLISCKNNVGKSVEGGGDKPKPTKSAVEAFLETPYPESSSKIEINGYDVKISTEDGKLDAYISEILSKMHDTTDWFNTFVGWGQARFGYSLFRIYVPEVFLEVNEKNEIIDLSYNPKNGEKPKALFIEILPIQNRYAHNFHRVLWEKDAWDKDPGAFINLTDSGARYTNFTNYNGYLYCTTTIEKKYAPEHKNNCFIKLKPIFSSFFTDHDPKDRLVKSNVTKEKDPNTNKETIKEVREFYWNNKKGDKQLQTFEYEICEGFNLCDKEGNPVKNLKILYPKLLKSSR